MKPTVGRIVHFYNPAFKPGLGELNGRAGGYNGQGAGPYAATIVQAFETDGEVSYCNLAVIFPFEGMQFVGSVAEKGSRFHTTDMQSYWEWPPREELSPGLRAAELAHTKIGGAA